MVTRFYDARSVLKYQWLGGPISNIQMVVQGGLGCLIEDIVGAVLSARHSNKLLLRYLGVVRCAVDRVLEHGVSEREM